MHTPSSPPRSLAIPQCFSVQTVAWWLALFLLGFFVMAASLQAQDRIVELEIISGHGGIVGEQQRWMEMLNDVGADRVVLKSGRPVTPEAEETQVASTTLITITGALQKGKLFLPGGTFSLRDKAKIRELIQRFRDDGAKVALAEKMAFGLTSEQLVQLHQTLSQPLDFKTQGESSADVIQKISTLINVPLEFDSAAQTALRGQETVAEELEGVTAGTALAVIARPLGLVLQPRRLQGKEPELRIVDSQTADEHWPIGWPLEVPPIRVAPKLFDRIDMEIRGFPLHKALNAIEKRSGVPFLYDHNSMAEQGIELEKTKVTLVQNRVGFLVAVDKLLRQCKPKMIEELRVDEKGKPFLWISPQ